VGIRYAYHATAFIRKFGTNFADMQLSLGRYIVRSRTKATEFSLVLDWVMTQKEYEEVGRSLI
jgi:hypothetical protein